MELSPLERSNEYDDFLKLRNQCFAHTRLLLLVGVSGSGKSTAMKYLASEHPSYCHRQITWLCGLPVQWSRPTKGASTLFIDEVRTLYDLLQVLQLAATGHQLVVASHLPLPFFLPARASGALVHFRTDACSQKLSRYLHLRRIPHTADSLARYVQRFGANYTDLDIILERHPSRSFDQALHRFERFDRLAL